MASTMALGMIYAAGVTIVLIFGDERLPRRVGLALAWPLAPLAFVVTVSVLGVAALVLLPGAVSTRKARP